MIALGQASESEDERLLAGVRELIFALFEVDAQGRAIIPLADLGVVSLSTNLGPLQAEAEGPRRHGRRL